MSAVQCGLATARARLEIEAGRREQAAGAAGGGSANELMSQPGLAVSTSLSPPQGEDEEAGRGRGKGQGSGGGDGMAAKCARLEKENAALKRENAVSSGPNTPAGRLSIANIMRRKFRAIVGLAYRHGEVSGRSRGGQPGHKGRSNNDPVEALFRVPPPTECPDCDVQLVDGNSGTTRYWLRPSEWMLGLEPENEAAAEMLRVSEELARHGAFGRPVCVSVSFKRGKCPRCGVVF